MNSPKKTAPEAIQAKWRKFREHDRKIAFTKTDAELICRKKPYYTHYLCSYGGGHHHLTKSPQHKKYKLAPTKRKD